MIAGQAADQSFLNLLSEYTVDRANLALTDGRSVNMRAPILDAIQSTLGAEDPEWFARTQTFGEKDGNLNIEGISNTHPTSPFDLVWGVRSPLFAPDFATFHTVNGKRVQVLDSGLAILVFVKEAFSAEPVFEVKTINLNGKGVRSIEYIPSLRGYLISSGPVPKADNYRLWLYRPAGPSAGAVDELIDVTDRLPQFYGLGRPEAILNRGHGNGLGNGNFTVFSEQDPNFSAPQPTFNFIDATVALGRPE
jgi:hypothetical protein